jgi:hypothetical protein
MGGLLLLCPLVLQAATLQSPPPTSDHELVRQLLERVQQLEAEVRDLKARAAADSPATQKPVATAGTAQAGVASPRATAVPSGEPQMPGMAQATEAGEFPNLKFHGFADVDYHASSSRDEHNSFALGQFNLFITSNLSDRISVIAEPVVEANDRNQFGIELERLLLQVAASEYFNVSVGRYHTAIGWYNTAYHHSAWLQTAVGRPFLFDFEDEGGILPIHNVGVTVGGRIPSGPVNLRYVAEAGNGRASRSPLDEPTQNVHDENSHKAVNFALLARPDWLRGFQTGFSVYYDRLAPAQSSRVGQTIVAVHAVYQSRIFEWLNEGVFVRHSVNDTGRVFTTPGFYTQVARQFGSLKPYFRYQYVDAPPEDPFYAAVGRMYGPSFGLRYDFSQLAAFKAQYDRTAYRGAPSVNGFTGQLSFAF